MRKFILLALMIICAVMAHAQTATNFSTTVANVAATAIQLQGSVPGGNVISYQVAGFGCSGCTAPTNGTIQSLNTTTGMLVYKPNAGFTGIDTLTFKVGATPTGGGSTTLSSLATLTITVSNAKTRVVDTLPNPDGSPRSGKITFFLVQAATGPAGLITVTASVSATLNSAGQFDVQLYPTTALSPQTYYNVRFQPSNSTREESLGVFNIPASTSPVALWTNRVLDANLAARYTIADQAAVSALKDAIVTQSLAGLTGITLGRITKVDSTGKLSDAPMVDGSTELEINKKTKINADLQAQNYVGIQNQHLPPTISDKQIANSTLNNPTVTGQVQGNMAVQGTLSAQILQGSCAGCTGGGQTGAVINPGATTVGADSDSTGDGVVDLQTRGIPRLRAENGGGITVYDAPGQDNQAARRYEVEAEGEEVRSSRFANLAAAATAIGSSETNLLVNKNITCNSAVDWPAQSVIKFTGRGKIVFASGCVLTFKGPGIEASPNRQIFSGFTSNASTPPIKWDTSYPDQISFKWFGGSISATGAANSNAWRLMFDAQAASMPDGSNPTIVRQGANVYIPPSTSACYPFDDTAQITRPSYVHGAVSAGWYRTTCLSFPKGKTGIYVNGENTWLSPYSSGPVYASFTTLENLTVIGGGYKHDATTSPIDMSVDTTSGSLVVNRNSSDTTHTFGQDIAAETTVTINRYSYAIAAKNSTTQITLQKPRIFVVASTGVSTVLMLSGIGPHTLSGATVTSSTDWVGQQIEIDSKLYTISSMAHNNTSHITTITLSTNFSGTTNATGTDCIGNGSPCHRGTATIQSLNTMSAKDLWVNNAHGFDLKGQVTLKNFHVRNFAGNGVQASTPSMPLGASTCTGCVNQNNSHISRGMIYDIAGHGITTFGLETNNIAIDSVDVSQTMAACFLMGSFLGVTYRSTHCASAELAGFYNPFGGGAAGSNRIKDAYVESGTPSNVLSQGDRLDETGGGVDPASNGVATNTSSSFFNMTNLQVKRD
ncbi:MAG TPA: Ig-like domain-containing protein, partial [Blastocatellia bacterium]|nr:Ig-like domain-containing protein [Blastocatellia bacterium]